MISTEWKVLPGPQRIVLFLFQTLDGAILKVWFTEAESHSKWTQHFCIFKQGDT